MNHLWITGDSKNDLKINIFLAEVESAVKSAVDVEVDVDLDADTGVVFKDPAQLPTAQHWAAEQQSNKFNCFMYNLQKDQVNIVLTQPIFCWQPSFP